MIQLAHMKFEVPSQLLPLIEGFVQRKKEDLLLLKKHLESRDFEQITSIAHKIKGSGTGYGFPIISDIGQKMESSSQLNDKSKTELLIIDLAVVTDEIEKQFLQKK